MRVDPVAVDGAGRRRRFGFFAAVFWPREIDGDPIRIV